MGKSFDEVIAQITPDVRALSAIHETEARGLFDLCQAVPENGIVIEVGCQLGASTAIIAQVGYERDYRTIHVDPYTQQPDFLNGWTNMMLRITGDWDHKFTLLCMRTEQGWWELSKLLSEGVDLAFIDGDHSTEGVRTDMRYVASRIRPRGVLTCHDYSEQSFPGVAIAVDEYVGHGGWEKLGQYHSMGAWRRL